MKIRTANISDIDQLVNSAQKFHSVSNYSDINFSVDKTTNLFKAAILDDNYFFEIIEEKNFIRGGLLAYLGTFYFSNEVAAFDLGFFVDNNYRSFCVNSLVKRYVKWATVNGAKRIKLSQSTGIECEKFGLLMKMFGFEFVGGNYVIYPE